MLVVFSPIFVAGTKINCGYNFVASLNPTFFTNFFINFDVIYGKL